ncbi:hypothetical protein E1218_19825 [Kribbella turkmenica]|uniref:Uncharacterized protein n=1 Tax=Kribbella turkmenica TaxID=2530375 RepID=A0A4R4WWM0_9ACTN|nr:hypothetical protein [Kribbella turkmenica]TDD22203.1 hypothetical protein E1218_19825 [Kribbella turkmenica]
MATDSGTTPSRPASVSYRLRAPTWPAATLRGRWVTAVMPARCAAEVSSGGRLAVLRVVHDDQIVAAGDHQQGAALGEQQRAERADRRVGQCHRPDPAGSPGQDEPGERPGESVDRELDDGGRHLVDAAVGVVQFQGELGERGSDPEVRLVRHYGTLQKTQGIDHPHLRSAGPSMLESARKFLIGRAGPG